MNILVSGASIAGPALAYWLRRNGMTVTVVERAGSPRLGGQAIDVRGAALEVLRGMGLLEAARALRTQVKGVSAVDPSGSEIYRSEERTFTGGRFAAGDVELLRDDLARLLRDAADVTYVYGDTITSLEQSAGGVDVSFARSSRRRFDLVIGADGTGSVVRPLVFGDSEKFVESLGVGIAVYTMPNILGLRDWQVVHEGETSGFVVYTARENTELRVTLGVALDGSMEERGVIATQKALVARRCAHLGWEIPRLLPAMATAPHFWFGAVAKVRMPSWSAGRVALVGDAGYSPSPFSGQGTSLALVGAFVLAQELRRANGDHVRAFARYEERLRPYVEQNQALARADKRGPVDDAEIDAAKNAIDLELA